MTSPMVLIEDRSEPCSTCGDDAHPLVGVPGLPWRICDWCSDVLDRLASYTPFVRPHPRGEAFTQAGAYETREQINEARRPAHVPALPEDIAQLYRRVRTDDKDDRMSAARELANRLKEPEVRALVKARDVCYFCDGTPPPRETTLSGPGVRICVECLCAARALLSA